MAQTRHRNRNSGPTRYTIAIIAALTLVVISITLVGILKSRRDSYNLLVRQGAVFTEALALACTNTIVAESYYDRFVSNKNDDLIDGLISKGVEHLRAADFVVHRRRSIRRSAG
jgi:hypothetical protein